MPTTLTPYLSFPGNTREAFAFYERALGGRITAMMRFADMPPQPQPAEGCAGGGMPSGDAIMHAALVLPGGAMVYAGDPPPGVPYEGVKGVMLALSYDDVGEAQRVFAALSDGGTIQMPMAPAFWAKTFGMVTDRYGIGWGVNGGPIEMK